MNSLNRAIKPGEVVIIAKRFIVPEWHHDRRFRCETGFGLALFTSGSHIGGVWLVDGEESTIRGDWIDPDETAAYQAQQAQAS